MFLVACVVGLLAHAVRVPAHAQACLGIAPERRRDLVELGVMGEADIRAVHREADRPGTEHGRGLLGGHRSGDGDPAAVAVVSGGMAGAHGGNGRA